MKRFPWSKLMWKSKATLLGEALVSRNAHIKELQANLDEFVKLSAEEISRRDAAEHLLKNATQSVGVQQNRIWELEKALKNAQSQERSNYTAWENGDRMQRELRGELAEQSQTIGMLHIRATEQTKIHDVLNQKLKAATDDIESLVPTFNANVEENKRLTAALKRSEKQNRTLLRILEKINIYAIEPKPRKEVTRG